LPEVFREYNPKVNFGQTLIQSCHRRMTSADIRDVLSISSTAPTQKKKKTKPIVDPAIKNATGITRELYSLLGEGTPPIAFIKQDRFKEKPKLNKKAAPW
jgi:DNA methyltransferase 1-associated protein 1